MTSVFAGIKELDPVEGLVQFVLDIKPYHTKIIEVIVEYIYTDPLNVTILDELDWDIFLAEPARLPAEGCCDGFSVVNFGNPGIYPVASPNPIVSSVVYPAINPIDDSLIMLTCGDPKVFTPGTQFRLFAFLEDYSNIHTLIMPSVAVAGDYDFTTPTCTLPTITAQTYDYSTTNCSMGTAHSRLYDYLTTLALQTVVNTSNVPTSVRTATTSVFDVFVNGVLQREFTDYTTTGPAQVTFSQPFQLNDEIMVLENFNSFYDYLTVVNGQTIVNTVNVPTVSVMANIASFSVYVNGILQRESIDYSITGPNQITFLQPFQGGEELTFIELKSLGADNIVEGQFPSFGQTVINTVNVPIIARSASNVFFDVYINGTVQRENDSYTVTGPNQITFLQPFQGTEDVFFILFDYLDDDNVYDYITATAAQIIFNTINVPTIARTASAVFFDVYVNGLLQQEGIEYTITGANQITFTSPLVLGDRVAFIKLINNFYDYVAFIGSGPAADNFDYISSGSGQTVFNTIGTPTTARTASVVFFDVYVNGLLKVEGVEYTVTGANQITFTSPLVLGDRVAFIKLINNFYDYITSGAGQTIFNTINVPTTARTPTTFSFDVYVNGILQRDVSSYTITGPNQITFTSPLVLGDSVVFVSNDFTVSDEYDFITGAAAQTVVNTTSVITAPRTGNSAFFEVFINGILQYEIDSYTVTGTNQFTLVTPLTLGDDVTVNQIVETVITGPIVSTINVPTLARTVDTFYFDVYVNGVYQRESSSYNVTGPNQITFIGPLIVGDAIVFVSNSTFAVNKYDFITGAAAQTIVNTTNVVTLPRTATSAFFEVLLNGILQYEIDSYTVTGPNQFTFIAPLVLGDDVVVNQLATSAISGCSQTVNSIVPTTARTPTNATFEVFMNGIFQREITDYTVIGPNSISMVIPLNVADEFTFITALNGPYDYITASSGQVIVNTVNVSTLPRTSTQATFDVYVNGLLQQETFNYSVTGPNQITFVFPMFAGDSIVFISTTAAVVLLYDYVVGSSGQSVVNTVNVPTTLRTPTTTFFEVYVNGLLQEEGLDYTVTGFNQITLTLSLSAGDRVTFTAVLQPTICQNDVDTVNVSTTARGPTTVFFDVFREGLLQREGVDYNVTSPNEVTFTTTLTPGEDINFLEQISAVYEYFVSIAAQTVFITSISTQAQTGTTTFTIVYVDGILQDEGTEFNVTGPNQVTLTIPLLAGQLVTIHFYSVGFIYDMFVSLPAQTLFTTTNNINLTIRTATQIFFSIYLNGLYLEEGVDYNITSATTFVLTLPALGGDIVQVFANTNPIVLFPPSNTFFVLGDQTAQFVPFYTFDVVTPWGDSGTYTVTGAGSTFVAGITIIPVFQMIQHFSGIIGVEVTPGSHMFEGIGGTNLYTVETSIFDNGRIPMRTNPADPFSLDMGVNTHLIITTVEDIISPIPPLGPDQFYIVWISLVPFNIEEVIPYSPAPFVPPSDFPDESAFLDIGSNMFVIDGNKLSTFHQGIIFDVISGPNDGVYTALYADFVGGKTRIRTLEGIAFTGNVPGQISFVRPGYSQHETSALTVITGFQLFSATDVGAGVGQTIFNLTSLTVPGSNPSLIVVTINGVPAGFTLNTSTQFTITSPLVRVNDLISATVYELPQPGASAFCGSIPPHELRVKFAEKLVFTGIGVAEFFDDLIVYNLENTDTYSYELPTTTIFSTTTPPVPSQPTPPAGAAIFDLWFDTSTSTFRQLVSDPTSATAVVIWRGIVTAYWFDIDDNKFFKRSVNQFTDTGWFEDVFGGFNQVFAATSATTVIDTQLFSTGPSAQTTFTLTTPVPNSDPSLLGVTIGGVPAGFTLNTSTQFTITSPTPGIDQVVVATVKSRAIAPIVSTNSGTDTFVVAGNLTSTFTFGFAFRVVNSTGNNGTYIVASSVFAVGFTTIAVTTSVPNTTGASGQIERFGRNAFVGTFNPNPHRIAHVSDFVAVDVVNNAFILKGGNFIERFRYNTFEGTSTIFGELGTWRPDTYPIIRVDDPTKTIFVQNDLTNIFSASGLVFQVIVSDNNREYFTVVSSSYSVANNETAIIVIQVVDETMLFNPPPAVTPISQNFSRDLGVIPGIIYNPIVSASPDQVKTLVYPTTPVNALVDGIEYTWVGPTHFDVGMNYTDLAATLAEDAFGASNNLTIQPISFNIIDVDMALDTFTIKRIDPVLLLPVDLTDSFTPGTQFRITDSFNNLNNYSTVIPEDGPPGTPAQGTPPTSPIVGDYWYDTSSYVRVATTANIVLSGLQTIDGELLVTGDRILVKNQTTTSQNGVYIVAAGAWTRALDFDTAAEFVNAHATVTEGTMQANTSWLGNIGPPVPPPVVGVSSILWSTTVEVSAVLRQFDGLIWNEVFVFNFPWTVLTATFNGVETIIEVVEDITNQTPTIGAIPQPYFGKIIREPFVVTERSGNTATATILDMLQFGWGETTRFLILSTDTNLANNFFVVGGDQTGTILTNDRIDIIGTQGNDGEYNVVSVTYNIGLNESTITVQEPIPVQPMLETGVVQLNNIDITDWFQYLIASPDGLTLGANATTDEFRVNGNATGDIQVGMEIRVLGTTSNNGIYTVISTTFVPAVPNVNPAYTIIGVTAGSIVANSLGGGFIESVRDYGIRLVLRDTIGVSTAEDATAALVTTGGSLVGAWDYSAWDIGSLDESIPTVIHLYGNTFIP